MGEPGVALAVNILPPWWATTWFRLFIAAFVLAMVGLLYTLRLRQLDREFNAQLDTRVAERTRIARDLHDTLLQFFHGLMFRFQAARNMLPRSPESAMRTLDEAISNTRMPSPRAAMQFTTYAPIPLKMEIWFDC